MGTTIVTGFIPVSRHSEYRSEARYRELGQQLLDLGLPTIAFLPPEFLVMPRPAATWQQSSLEECWMTQHLGQAKLPPTDNPNKDTAEFHAIQLQKSHWVARASLMRPANTLIWLDFGILHVPGATPQLIREFYARVNAATIDRITMASIWPLGQEPINPMQPNWYFAGGAFIVPHRWALRFAHEVERTTLHLLEDTGYLTWEVNVWAKIAQQYPDMFDTWPCDHNATMFTGF